MASLSRKQLRRVQPDDDDDNDDASVQKRKALILANFVTVGLVVLAVIFIFDWGTS